MHSEAQMASFLGLYAMHAVTAWSDKKSGWLTLDCPHFQGLRQQHAEIFQDSHDAMRSLMWHNDQKSVCALVLAIVNEAQTA